VAERQKDQALKRIQKQLKMDAEIDILFDAPSNGQGSFLFLLAEYGETLAGFSSLGARGKPAEKVADEAVDLLKDYVGSDGSVDPYLADQLLAFMALAKGNSSFTTTLMTDHLFTNLWVIEQFLDIVILRAGERGRGGRIEISSG
jgi:RNA 3'-terminal phosphate cyclase (ATP)